MSRAMNSGIAGMSVNQAAMDVISNNIANQTTTSFKGSRTRFQDMLYENMKDANSPALTLGGTNASQVGLGVQIAGIDVDTKQGNVNTTGRNLDAMIDGSGYFVVTKGTKVFGDNSLVVNQSAGTHNVDSDSLAKVGSQFMYTRDGSFTLDSEGNLLTSDGYRVMGYPVTNDPKSTTQDPTAIKPGAITDGTTVYQFSAGTTLNDYTITVSDGGASSTTGVTITDPVYDPTTGALTTAGTITVSYDATAGASLTSIQKAINSALAEKGIPQTVQVTSTTAGATKTTDAGLSASAITGGTPLESIATDGSINYVDGTLKLYAYDTNLKTLRIPEKVLDTSTGTYSRVTSFTISKDGTITGTLEDGRVAALGQLAMASFKNPAGLLKQGQNMYTVSVNSGNAILNSGVNTKGESNSAGYGEVRQGALEMSNVDLAQQFADMIVTSRAFQANGKIINTSDEMLQDVINLKR